MIAYVWSMELGKPPVYQTATQAQRNNDPNFYQTLGPFAVALNVILKESEKSRLDKIKPLKEIPNYQNLNYFAQSFLAFRGAPLERDWILPFEE